ncbi:MAG TPA: hypothetical protein VIQ30_11530, partial [Pseudonocardia sp.]
MAWPDDKLPVLVEIAPGADLSTDPDTWPWVDVSSSARIEDGIVITEGRGDWGDQVDAGSCALVFNNPDGDFSQHNPLGQWYGLIGRDTPLRVSLDLPSGVAELFGGFVPAWVSHSDLTGTIRTVPVVARGVLSRLKPAQGTPPARSALRRTISASGPVAYYPIEDGALSGQAASAITGHPAMTVTGSVEFTEVDGFVFGAAGEYGTSALANLKNGGSLRASLPASVTTDTQGAWTVHIVADADPASMSGDMALLEWTTPRDTYVRWQLQVRTAGVRVLAWDAAGVSWLMASIPSIPVGLVDWAVSCYETGGTIIVSLYAGDLTDLAPATAGGLDGITSITVNVTGTTSTVDVPAGHVAVWPISAVPIQITAEADTYGELVGGPWVSWLLEAAHIRLERLCTEDGITLEVGTTTEPIRMGSQKPGTPLDLYRQCADTDGGVLYERPFRLAYQLRTERYNQTPALTLTATDLAEAPTPDPTGQGYRNRWTVKRIDGSSAVAETPEVTAGTTVVYDGTADLSLADDTGLPDQAGLRLHLTSGTDLRWPQLEFNFEATPTLLDAWLACRIGSRILVTDEPADVAGSGIDVLLEGHTTTLGYKSIHVVANCSPARPWDVAEADGDQRVPADGSTLAAGIDADDLTLSLASTAANGVWVTGNTITAPTDFPLDLRIGGERVTCAGISGAASPQTVTLSARAV